MFLFRMEVEAEMRAAVVMAILEIIPFIATLTACLILDRVESQFPWSPNW